MLGEDFFVDARTIIEAVEIGGGGELEEVAETFLVAGEQRQVVGGVADATSGCAVGATSGSDVSFVTDDGLDAGFGALGVEVYGAKEVTVIGESEGTHAHVTSERYQSGHHAGAIQQAVVAVHVQMDEVFAVHGDMSPEGMVEKTDGAWYLARGSKSRIEEDERFGEGF